MSGQIVNGGFFRIQLLDGRLLLFLGVARNVRQRVENQDTGHLGDGLKFVVHIFFSSVIINDINKNVLLNVPNSDVFDMHTQPAVAEQGALLGLESFGGCILILEQQQSQGVLQVVENFNILHGELLEVIAQLFFGNIDGQVADVQLLSIIWVKKSKLKYGYYIKYLCSSKDNVFSLVQINSYIHEFIFV